MVRYVSGVNCLRLDHALPKLILIGTKETPGLDLGKRIIEHLLNSSVSAPNEARKTVDSMTIAILTHAIQELDPDTDNPVYNHVYLPLGECVLSCVVALLPTAVSRHNSFARPHAISTIIKSNVGDYKAPIVVGLALPHQDKTWKAAGYSVARGVPAYFHKSTEQRGVITTGHATSFEADNVQVVFKEDLTKEQVHLLNCTANGIHLTQRLVDAPPNELNTDTFTEEAKAVAKRCFAHITVIRGEELRQHGFGGLYGVGQAACHPPALVILSHFPNEASKVRKSVALVGKGIVYDTGGLDIKIHGSMVGMKSDMGGAAGLLGGFEAAVLSGIMTTTPLHCILCLAENAVGPLATRPDDVHLLYSGKAVEVNDTDAEGRLALGDGVAYAVRHLNPNVILDMATLTGAQGIATGMRMGAMYTNSDAIEGLAIAAGKESGDLVHPVPYIPEFFRQEYSSAVADMKNYMKNPKNAGVSCAGQFVGNHLGAFLETDYNHVKNGQHNQNIWIHIDMAYPVDYKEDKRATGYGVGFVLSILERLNHPI
jgi:probable aminopeptidase NPEPL1